MKKICILIMALILFPQVLIAGEIEEVRLEPVMPGYAVFAAIAEDTNVYKEHRRVSKVLGQFSVGATVEILKDYSLKWYLVECAEQGVKGWVERKVLAIPPDEPAEKWELTTFQLEQYMNSNEISSNTAFLIYTDLWRQRTYIFTGSKGSWRLLRTFVCSTGKNESPTTRGTFKTSESGTWFYSKRLGSGGKFWVRFNETYLFHSVAMNSAKQVIDPTLGERSSSGCVRHSVEDAEWIYKNIPVDTTVVIN